MPPKVPAGIQAIRELRDPTVSSQEHETHPSVQRRLLIDAIAVTIASPIQAQLKQGRPALLVNITATKVSKTIQSLGIGVEFPASVIPTLTTIVSALVDSILRDSKLNDPTPLKKQVLDDTEILDEQRRTELNAWINNQVDQIAVTILSGMRDPAVARSINLPIVKPYILRILETSGIVASANMLDRFTIEVNTRINAILREVQLRNQNSSNEGS